MKPVAAARPVKGRKLTAPASRTPGIFAARSTASAKKRRVGGSSLYCVARERDARGQQSLGLEARVDAAQRREALEHQARADQQDDGEGDLRDDESLAEDPRPHAGASGTRAVLERVLDVGPRAGEGRSETAEPRREHRDQEREGQDLRAQAKQGETGQICRAQRDEKRDAPSRQQEAHGASHEGQEQVLRQQLGEDPPAARAERRADGHLPHAGGAPREEQARHVRAGDEEHEAHGAEKDQERRAHLARDLGVQGNDLDAPALVAIRELVARAEAIAAIFVCADAGVSPGFSLAIADA